MRKDGKWIWAIIVAGGLVMVTLIASIIMFATKSDQSSSANPALQSSDSEKNTGRQGTPSYSSEDCQPQTNCSSPRNQSQGQGTPPIQGTITAVSESSISIRPTEGGATKTLGVTSTTKIMKSTASTAYKASDLHVGQAVTAVATLQDSTVVEYIALDDTGRLNNVNE